MSDNPLDAGDLITGVQEEQESEDITAVAPAYTWL